MSDDKLPFTGLGPFQAFFNGMSGSEPDAPAMPVDRVLRSFARCQSELQGLLSRRAQAYVELPSRIAEIRTAQDMFREQTRFWQTAMQQYAECSQRMMGSWMQSLQAPGTRYDQRSQVVSRDYLAESEPAAPRYHSEPVREPRRKVA